MKATTLRITQIGFIFSSIAVTALAAQSCAVLGQPIAEKIASAVEKYCEEPLSYREVYRNTVNAQLVDTMHEVHVHCAGDPRPE